MLSKNDKLSLVRKRMNRNFINEGSVFKRAVSKWPCSKKKKKEKVSAISIWLTLDLPQCHKDRRGKKLLK